MLHAFIQGIVFVRSSCHTPCTRHIGLCIGKRADKSYFAFDETEKAAILKKLEGKKILIQRSKGLGENQADMMWETTMNPETRRLIRITPDEAAATSEMFDLLLGDNLSGRKEYIAEHGADYLELADIS